MSRNIKSLCCSPGTKISVAGQLYFSLKKKKKIREENNVLCFFLTKQVDTEFPLSLPPSDLNFIFYFGGG